MEPQIVRTLEYELEEAISQVITRLGSKHLPLLPSQRTMHLMAKAAVTVYEVAVESNSPSKD